MHTSRLFCGFLLSGAVGLGCADTPTPKVPGPTTAEPLPIAANTLTAPTPTVLERTPASPLINEGSDGSASFTWSAYAALRGTGANYVFSGASLRRALAMAAAGARGVTKSEMDSVLGPGGAKDDASNSLTSPSGPTTVRIANRLWADEHVTVRAEYTDTVRSQFGATLELLPMRTDAEAARMKVNAWVSDQTSGKIVDLLPKGAIHANSRLVVTNAVYFKAPWQAPFTASMTKDEPFTDESGKKKNVPTMRRESVMRAAELPDAKLVELDYRDSDFVMTLVLPNDVNGLAKIETSMTAAAFTKALESLKLQRVSLFLPRFKFRAGGNVNRALQQLGIRAAFSTSADFSGILQEGAGPLMLDSVFHDAFIAVDEQGTEAAAATALVMGVRSMPLGKPMEIRADHAFLFVIRNKKSGHILFLGRVAQPAT